eukprot:460767_1
MIHSGEPSVDENKSNDLGVIPDPSEVNIRDSDVTKSDDRRDARLRRQRINEMAHACRGGPVGVPHGEIEDRPPAERLMNFFGREIPMWQGCVLITLGAVILFGGCALLYHLKFRGPADPPCNLATDVLKELNLIWTGPESDGATVFNCIGDSKYFKNDAFTVDDLGRENFKLEVATSQTRTCFTGTTTQMSNPLKNCDVKTSKFTHGGFGDWMYVGQVNAEGKRNGNGTTTFDDGEVYVGQWVNDSLEGIAKQTYASGNVHVGQFENNHLHGIGKIVQDGKTYDVVCDKPRECKHVSSS